MALERKLRYLKIDQALFYNAEKMRSTFYGTWKKNVYLFKSCVLVCYVPLRQMAEAPIPLEKKCNQALWQRYNL